MYFRLICVGSYKLIYTLSGKFCERTHLLYLYKTTNHDLYKIKTYHIISVRFHKPSKISIFLIEQKTRNEFINLHAIPNFCNKK